MKILLHSDHKWTEKSFPFILAQLNRAKGFNFTAIDRVPAPHAVAPFVPQANGYNYPDWKWFYDYLTFAFEDQYDMVVWHEERKKGQSFQDGATNKYNGVYDTQTNDRTFNCVVFADNKANNQRTRDHHSLYPGMTDFERIFIHEASHGASRFKEGTDVTHYWDYIKNDIPGAFDTYDVALYKPQRTLIGLLEKLKAIFIKEKTIQPLVKRQADKIISEMSLLGHPVRIVEGYRSLERQTELYAQGRNGDKRSIVTNAKAGESLHNYGVAVDFVFVKEGYNASEPLWQTLGLIGKKHGFEWGGSWQGFVDRPHFEMTLGYSLADFQKGLVDYKKYK